MHATLPTESDKLLTMMGYPNPSQDKPAEEWLPWQGTIAMHGVPTRDGRTLILDEDMEDADRRTIPLFARREGNDADSGSQDFIGTATEFWVDGNAIKAGGYLTITPDTTWGTQLLAGESVSVGILITFNDARLDDDSSGQQLRGFTPGDIRSITIREPVWPEARISLTTDTQD